MPHASNPLRLTHKCNLPCMKTISKTKDFCFNSHESFIGHTPIIMLDHPPIFFIGHTPKILWTTLRYFHWTYSDNNVGQPSDKNCLFKAMSCSHTRYTRCPHAHEMRCYCMVFTYLNACVYQYHSRKTACYSAKN